MALAVSVFLTTVLINIVSTQPPVEQRCPGLKLRLTQNGLEYSKRIGLKLLRDHVTGDHLADAHRLLAGGNGAVFGSLVRYDVSNTKLTSLSAPDSQSSLSTEEGQGVVWKAWGIAASLVADYKLTMGSGFFSLSRSGSVSAAVYGGNFRVAAVVSAGGDGKPSVAVTACRAYVTQLSMTFHGGIFEAFLNLFRNSVANYFRDRVNMELCVRISEIINVQANRDLQGIPLTIAVNSYVLNYHLVGNPVFQKDFIQLNMRGEVTSSEHLNSTTPLEPECLTDNFDSAANRSFDVQVTEYLLNSFTYTAHKLGVLRRRWTNDTLQNLLGSGSFLHTSCERDEGCIGSVIPEIGQKFPNSFVFIDAQTSEAPLFSLRSSEPRVSVKLELNFKAQLENGSAEQLFTAIASLGAVLIEPKIENFTVKGKVKSTHAQLSLTNSTTLGSIDQYELEDVYKAAVMMAVDNSLSKAVEAGIEIPPLPFAVLKNSLAIFQDHFLLVASDFSYEA